MATLAVGSAVSIDAGVLAKLAFPPTAATLCIACHPMALRAPQAQHTQVVAIENGRLVWAGALGEELLRPTVADGRPDAREVLASSILSGSRLWDIIRPGALLVPGTSRPLSTIYDGSDARPWVVIGMTPGGDLLAAPLNETSNPRWFTPVISRQHMQFPDNHKDSQVEVAHVWSLPATIASVGRVLDAGVAQVEQAIRREYELPQA